MAREQYLQRRFQKHSLVMIDRVNQIIAEYYEGRGLHLIIRQIHYQFVARSWYANIQSRYNALVYAITNGRDAGLIDWDAIEDRSRTLRQVSTWDSPEDILAAAAESYKEDLWATQPRHIEIWVEKDSLAGMFDAIHHDYRVPIYPHRGDDSTSMMRAAGVRLAAKIELGSEPLILMFTDHDPTGIDMRRDIPERLAFYTRQPIEVRLLGLTTRQARARYDGRQLPPNFAKETDKNYKKYVAIYGPECWELDALPPDLFDQLAREVIEAELDRAAWAKALAREARNRRKLTPRRNK